MGATRAPVAVFAKENQREGDLLPKTTGSLCAGFIEASDNSQALMGDTKSRSDTWLSAITISASCDIELAAVINQ
jgi:hypothetical protein